MITIESWEKPFTSLLAETFRLLLPLFTVVVLLPPPPSTAAAATTLHYYNLLFTTVPHSTETKTSPLLYAKWDPLLLTRALQ